MKSAFTHWANLEATCDDSSMNLNYVNLHIMIANRSSFTMLVSIPDRRHSCPPRRLVSLGCCSHWMRSRECL